MQAQRLVELGHQARRDHAQSLTDAPQGDGSDLLGLGLGITDEPCRLRRQTDLERVDTMLEVTGTTVTTPRPRRVAVAFTASLLTMTAGRRLAASEPTARSMA
jgi:hypothetical protein